SWGSWDVNGTLNRRTKAGSAHLKTQDGVPIRKELLRRVPLVSPAVLQEIEIDGELLADLLLHVDLGTQTVHYHAAFDPRGVQLYVPGIDLRAEHVHGRFIAEDSLLQMENLEGDVANGRIAAHGQLNFFVSGPEGQLTVSLTEVCTEGLPG